MYLSSLRVNIAEESVVDHRVQLQCKVNELGGKSNKAIAELDLAKYLSSLDFGCLRSFGLSQFELHLFGLQGLRKDFFCKMT